MNIGENIKKYRKEKRITQKEFASLMNKSERMIQKYENGEIPPSLKILTDISKILEVDLSLLIQDSDFRSVTNPTKDEVDVFLDFAVPIEILKNLGFTILKRPSMHRDGTVIPVVFDIMLDDKLIRTLDLEGFCNLNNNIIQYKQIFDKSLILLIRNDISESDSIYSFSSRNKKLSNNNFNNEQ